MPIKLPRSFQLRKSSGNALEEVQNPPEPSFKVFERPRGGSKSFDGGQVLKRQVVAGEERRFSSQNIGEDEHENDELFPVAKTDAGNRGSGGTENSLSTRAPYSSAASSARLSSSSTIPSSSDAHSEVNINHANQRPFRDIPVPPTPPTRPGFSLRSASRTFSTGSKTTDLPPKAPASRPPTISTQPTPLAHGRRERAMTASSASTATPPRILDSDLTIDDHDIDGFSNMFDGIGAQTNRKINSAHDLVGEDSLTSSPAPLDLPRQTFTIPSPINVNRSQGIESSPYSWASHDSSDELIGSPSRAKPTPRERPLPALPRKGVPAPSRMTVSKTLPDLRPHLSEEDFGPRFQNQYPVQSSPAPMTNEAARLLAGSPQEHQNGFQQGRQRFENMGGNSDREVSLFARTRSPGRQNPTSESTTEPELSPPQSPPSVTIDPTLAASAHLAAQWEQSEPPAPRPTKKVMNKVMTPAQFERYRQEQEFSRRSNEATPNDQSDDGSDIYEDEDEAERDRQAAKQRQKQEAHLAVYRQTMMKVTGEQQAKASKGMHDGLGSRVVSLSLPDLTKRMSHLGEDTRVSGASGKSSGEEEEDEDVPLGILAAHGFPNKNRPPTRLSNQSSNQTPRAASIAGESTQGNRGSLPPFARHLPQDPYYGAGLVNPVNRESFAMGGGASVRGAPAAPTPHIHPSGLVGVIAGEERARAMRRGSPNAQGSYDAPGVSPQHPAMGRSQTMVDMSTMGFPTMIPGMAPLLSPGDHAQIQMSQQMQQMQVQMQQMMQMMQIHGDQQGQSQQLAQPVQQPGISPNLLAASHPSQIQRPLSMPMPMASIPRQEPRTMSTLSPNMAPWSRPMSIAPSLHGGVFGRGYASSIAPSERSNVGLASRYRPVSMAPESINPATKRSSTFTSGTFPPWADSDGGRFSPNVSTLRPAAATYRRASEVPDDEDDDQGWAEMSRKRDKKKSTWKMRRQTGLQDLFHGGS